MGAFLRHHFEAVALGYLFRGLVMVKLDHLVESVVSNNFEIKLLFLFIPLILDLLNNELEELVNFLDEVLLADVCV